MSETYVSHEALEKRAREDGDLWRLVRLRLGDFECAVLAGNRAGVFTSRNRVLEAIKEYGDAMGKDQSV